MSNPEQEITPEGIMETKRRIKKIFRAICETEGIRIINWEKGIIETTRNTY